MTTKVQLLPLADKTAKSKGQPVRIGRAGNNGLKSIDIGTIFDLRGDAVGCFDAEVCAFAVHEQQDGIRPEASLSYFNDRSVLEGAIELAPDDRTGERPHDETIWVRARQVPQTVERIVVGAYLYRRGKRPEGHFGNFHDLEVYFHNGRGQQLFAVQFHCGPDGAGVGKTAVVLGELYRQDGDWMFKPSGSAVVGWLPALCRKHGVEVKKAS